jgi:SAM-dependent methyltransferase
VRQTNYDEIAATYDRRYAEKEDYRDIERALMDFVGDRRQRVLEVGCGTGHWLHRLRVHGFRAVGIDPSWRMLAQARTNVAGCDVIRGCAEHLPFPHGTFDRVFGINAHHHFSDKLQFLREARSVLRTGGSLMTIALDPHTGADRWWVYDYFEGTLEIDKQRYPCCEQIRAWMREAGFADAYTVEVQHFPGDIAAHEAVRKGLIGRDHTSQLAVLSREEYNAGVRRIDAAMEQNPTVRLSADLRVYATYGTTG